MDDTRNTHAQLLQDNALLRQRLARLETEFSSAVDPAHELLPPVAPQHDARRVPADALRRPLAAAEARRCAMPEAAVRDLTVHQPAEHDLRRANRLALVGQFACGLAHEIGTPLNVIAGNAELLRMQYGALGLSTAELETIVMQSHRIARLLEQLLSFARSKEDPMTPLALRQPLQQVLGLLEPLFARAGITVIITVPADLPSIQGSSDQLEQVFLNLLVNAWQAMPSGGTITIDAYATPTHCVCLTCQDTGHGMSAQGLARAFESFYSTKGDKGTGLGLTMCQQIIASHGGRMALQSTPGEGTTVTVVLPQAGSVPEPEGDTRPLGARRGGRASAL